MERFVGWFTDIRKRIHHPRGWLFPRFKVNQQEEDRNGLKEQGVRYPLRGSLRARLILFFIAIAVPMEGLLVFQFLQEQELRRQRALESLELLSDLVVERYQDATLAQAQRMLSVLDGVPELRSLQPPLCQSALARTLERLEGAVQVGVTDPDGRILCQAGEPLFGLLPSTEIARALSRDGVHLSGYEQDPVAGRSVVIAFFPLDSLQGERVAFAVLDPVAVVEGFADVLEASTNVRLTIVDPEGAVLVDVGEGAELAAGFSLADAPVYLAAKDAVRAGTIEIEDAPGQVRLYAYHPVPDAGEPVAYVLVSIPRNLLFAESDRQFWWAVAGSLLLLTVLFSLAWWMVHRYVLRGFSKLIAAAERIREGDLEVQVAADVGGRH